MTDTNDQVTRLLSGVTVDGAGPWVTVPRGTHNHVFQGTIAGTGAVSATVTIEGSVDGVSAVAALTTLSLTGTTSDVKGGTLVNAPWPLLRARVAAISGTDATINVLMGI